MVSLLSFHVFISLLYFCLPFFSFFHRFLDWQQQAKLYNACTISLSRTKTPLCSVLETVGGNSVIHSECCHSEESRDTFTVQQMAHTRCTLWKPSILALRCFEEKQLLQCWFVLHKDNRKHIFRLESCRNKSIGQLEIDLSHKYTKLILNIFCYINLF